MLAAYLTWHLRQAWAPLTYTGEEPPAAVNPVAPARRSASAQAKASRQHDGNGRPYRSFGGLLAHPATLTRNELREASAIPLVPGRFNPGCGPLVGLPGLIVLGRPPGMNGRRWLGGFQMVSACCQRGGSEENQTGCGG
jgi:hypothetical protein